MKLELEIYGALCATKEFRVNGIEADYKDFGEQYDRDGESAEPYGCGDMRFTRWAPGNEVLKKYKITKEEYSLICDELEKKLSFGNCGWCI